MKINVVVPLLISILSLYLGSTPVSAKGGIQDNFRWHDINPVDSPLREAPKEGLSQKKKNDSHLTFSPAEPGYQQKKDPITGNVIEETYQIRVGNDSRLRHTERRDPISGETVDHSFVLDF